MSSSFSSSALSVLTRVVYEHKVEVVPTECAETLHDGWFQCPPGRYELPFALPVPVGLPPTGQVSVGASKGEFKYGIIAKAMSRTQPDATPVDVNGETPIRIEPNNMPMPDFIVPTTVHGEKSYTFSR